jgi:hypothetical protein
VRLRADDGEGGNKTIAREGGGKGEREAREARGLRAVRVGVRVEVG